MMKLILLSIFVIYIFTGCSNKYNLDNRIQNAQNIALDANFYEDDIYTEVFTIKSFFKIKDKNLPIKFYIEGDGFAWVNKKIVSSNPTPINPIALKLAVLDDYPNIVYLGRACQYVTNDNCNNSYWTNKRFSQEAIDSINFAIDILKSRSNSEKIKLFGFSGGGAVAVLIASLRLDVDEITTVAGNLNHKLLHEYHNLPYMEDSLNPYDVAPLVSSIKQRHYVSSNDEVIPISVIESFIGSSINNSDIKIIDLIEPTHTHGWEEFFKK